MTTSTAFLTAPSHFFRYFADLRYEAGPLACLFEGNKDQQNEGKYGEDSDQHI
jgi:hypothetical protein